ncbi:UNVERIFIED_CONTAM: Minichromosome maintenance domain-containing protein 2 [Siphonaria sp. JEL0065]|nr:Minichromosome maintenance domain-containing protein 2 [Siphonaria sp. JEL0065]
MSALTRVEQERADASKARLRALFSNPANSNATKQKHQGPAAQPQTEPASDMDIVTEDLFGVDVDVAADRIDEGIESVVDRDIEGVVPLINPFSRDEADVNRFHAKDAKKAIFESQNKKGTMKARFNNFRIQLKLDPMLLLDFNENMSLIHLDTKMERDLFNACLSVVNKMSGHELVHAEDLQVVIRAAYLPSGIPRTVISKTTSDGVKYEGIKRSAAGDLIQTLVELKYTQKIEVTAFDASNMEGCFSGIVNVILKDEIVNIGQVGDQLEVIGSYKRSSFAMDMTFQAALKALTYSVVFENPKLGTNKKTWKHEALMHQRRRLAVGSDGRDVPSSILALLDEDLSSFTFTQRLIDSFCAYHVPLKMWRKLRLSLLLSLVSTPPSTERRNQDELNVIRQAINVLVVTDDFTPMQQRLVSYAASFKRFAQWSIESSNTMNVVNAVGKDGGLERSTVSDAKDGVLFVNMDRVGKTDVKCIVEIVEKPVLETVVPGFSVPLLFHSNLRLWGACTAVQVVKGKVKTQSNVGGCGGDSRDLVAIPLTEITKPIIQPLISKFDICINLKSSSQRRYQEALAKHVLSSSIAPSDPLLDGTDNKDWKNDSLPPFVSHEDFARFIHTVSEIQVNIPTDCSDFLKKYFVLIRKTFGNVTSSVGASGDSIFVTMEALIRTAMAHARICLREEVLLDDVLVSIMLIEESLLLVTGVSVLGFVSLPEDQESIWSLCGDSGIKMEDVDLYGNNDGQVKQEKSYADIAILRLYEHIMRIFQSS